MPKEELSRYGGFNLKAPTGGWANGMPAKDSVLSLTIPTTVPSAMVTVGWAASCRSTIGPPSTETVPRRAVIKQRILVYIFHFKTNREQPRFSVVNASDEKMRARGAC